MRTFAILPAAGRSLRMGRPKLLLPWGETTLVQHVVRNWRASRVEQVILVLHPDDAEIAEHCQGAFTAVCERPPAEMKDSICYGVRVAEERFQAAPPDVWLVAPADMPAISPEVINTMLAAYEQSVSQAKEPPRIWVAQHAGRRGHPVLFTWTMAAEVAALGPEESLKTLFERHPIESVEVDSDGIFADLDTPEDYQRHRPTT